MKRRDEPHPYYDGQHGDTLRINLWYPRIEENAKYIVAGLYDVRATDDIRISFDFDRNGWKVEQARFFSWPATDTVCDPGWVEVAFVEAWSQRKDDDHDAW